jgi:hypothetical protein
MDYEELFVSPIGIFYLDVDFEKVKIEMMATGWKDNLLKDNLPDTSELMKCKTLMCENIKEYAIRAGLTDIAEHISMATATRIWHDYGQRETAHFHFGGLFSSIFYVDVPEGAGDLILLDPRGPIMWNIFNREDYNKLNYGPSNCRVYKRITPIQGMVIVTPSWLTHYSEQNLSHEPRILMVNDWTAFDFGQIEGLPLD